MALPTLRRAFGLVNFDKAGLGELAEATCLKLDLNREARTLEVSASFSRSLTYPELCGLQTKIQQAYTLRKVELTPVYAAFEDGDVPCLIDCAIKGDPICGAVLSDCGISREDGKLILRLRAPGAVFLEDAGTAREMERILRMSYSAPLKVVLTSAPNSSSSVWINFWHRSFRSGSFFLL